MVSLRKQEVKCYSAWFGEESLTVAADSYDNAVSILDGVVHYAEELALVDQTLDREKYLRLLHPESIQIHGEKILVFN